MTELAELHSWTQKLKSHCAAIAHCSSKQYLSDKLLGHLQPLLTKQYQHSRHFSGQPQADLFLADPTKDPYQKVSNPLSHKPPQALSVLVLGHAKGLQYHNSLLPEESFGCPLETTLWHYKSTAILSRFCVQHNKIYFKSKWDFHFKAALSGKQHCCSLQQYKSAPLHSVGGSPSATGISSQPGECFVRAIFQASEASAALK